MKTFAFSSNLFTGLLANISQRQWVPICHYSDLRNDKVKTIDFMNESIGVFKTRDGHVQTIKNMCPHRHSSFSDGKVKNDIFECPYHGAKFDGKTGECIDFLDGCHKTISTVQKYNVHQSDNIVWVNISGDDVLQPTLPDPSILSHMDENSNILYGTTDVNACAFDVIENLICPTHINFVHKFGNKDIPTPKNIVKNTVNDKFEAAFEFDHDSGGSSVFVTGRGTVNVVNGFYGPLSVYSSVRYGSNNQNRKDINVHVLPLSMEKSRLFWSIDRNFLKSSMFDPLVRFVMMDTIAEDAKILEAMDANRGVSKQDLIKYDWIIAKYRQKLIQNFQ